MKLPALRREVVRAGCSLALAAGGLAAADTLVLRDGRRIEGHLVGVRGDTIEFEDQSRRSRRVERYDREEVRRIELDANEEDDDHDWNAGASSSRPRGLRERGVSVAANGPWTDSGVDVRRGQRVYFTASGKVHWGQDRNDDAAGERNSPHNPGRPIPERPGGALIGRIDDGDPFFIGADEGSIRMPESGKLYLGVNDDYLQDNWGAFRVTIYH